MGRTIAASLVGIAVGFGGMWIGGVRAQDAPVAEDAKPAADAPAPPPGPEAPATPPPVDRPVIVVTATREPAEALRVPAHVTVITADEIERSTWRDVVDVLSVQPGLFPRRNSTTPQDIDVDARGFNNGGGNGQRLLVLVDGRKTNRVTGSNTDWAGIPMENIERIEIVRGPAAGLYGDTAVAGVVHIVTKDGAPAAERSLAVETGSYGRHHERLYASGQVEELSYAVFARSERSDGYRENSAYEGEDYTVKLGLPAGGDWRLRLKAGFHDDTRERPGTLTQGEAATFGRDASLTPGDASSVFASNGDVGLERRAGGTLKGAGPVDERTSAFLSWGHGRSDALTTFVGGGTTALRDDSDLFSLTFQHAELLRLLDRDMDDTLVTAGADLGYETADAASFNNFPPFFVQDQDTNYRRRLLGLFARAEVAVTEPLLLSAGGRFDRALFNFDQQTSDLAFGGVVDADGAKAFDQWNPQFGANYRWSATTSTYASWGRTMRYPNRDELIGFLGGFAPELRPERAATWEAGVREEWGRSFTGTLSVFRTDVRDEIFFVPPPAGAFAFGTNANVTHIRHQGVEAGWRWQVCGPFTINGSYTFTRTTLETGAFDRNQLPLTPRNQGMLGAEADLGCGFGLTTQTRIVGPRYLLNDLDNTTRGLPAYAVTDVGLRWRSGKFRAWATAYNALDREYYDNGGIGGFPHGSREAFNPAPDANFEIGGQVDF